MGQIQSHPFVYVLSMAVLALKQHRWVVVTKTAWPTKPKICMDWHFTEKFTNLCSLESLGRPLSAYESSWPALPFRGCTGRIGSSAQQSKPDSIRELRTDGLCLQTSLFLTCFCFCKKEAKPQLNVSLSLSPIVFGGIGCGCVLSFYPLALGLVSHQRLMYHFQPTDVPSKSPIFFPWKPFYFVCRGGRSLHKWFSERFLCPQCHFTRTC